MISNGLYLWLHPNDKDVSFEEEMRRREERGSDVVFTSEAKNSRWKLAGIGTR